LINKKFLQHGVKMFNTDHFGMQWLEYKRSFLSAEPFNHVIIDNFFSEDVALKLSDEFPSITDPNLSRYANVLENKLTLNHWDKFPPLTYRAFMKFGTMLTWPMEQLVDKELQFDYGLNGGGWHMHGTGGNNNVHLDYNIHPKLGMQRKLNIIVYMTPNWDSAWGGGLELWSHDPETNRPKKLIKTVENKFNRAIIFDTTQNSWHGLPTHISCPEGILRKSLAAYYVCEAPEGAENRGRALFAPREDQKNDPTVEEVIRKRADVNKSSEVYRKE
jgi:2OG-Fe(II) oxygenase superfamily